MLGHSYLRSSLLKHGNISMNNQIVKQSNEVTVLQDGSTLITQRKLAELIGKPEGTITKFFSRLQENVNTVNGLDEKTALLAVKHYALYSRAPSEEAKKLLEKVATAGIRAFNYHLAGYQVEAKPKMTHMEITASLANGLVEIERQQKAQQALLESQQERIEIQDEKLKELENKTTVLPSKPANAESVTYIRKRINKQYGFPQRIINEVLWSSPYAPKPAGQVRNTNENAAESTFTVWYKSDVTKLFERFASECEMVTKTQAVNPLIEGRFKMVDVTGE